MSSTYTDAAAFVLPVSASVVAVATALSMRFQAVVVARSHTADLAPTTEWYAGIAKRSTTGTSNYPQSRGSTG